MGCCIVAGACLFFAGFLLLFLLAVFAGLGGFAGVCWCLLAGFLVVFAGLCCYLMFSCCCCFAVLAVFCVFFYWFLHAVLGWLLWVLVGLCCCCVFAGLPGFCCGRDGCCCCFCLLDYIGFVDFCMFGWFGIAILLIVDGVL